MSISTFRLAASTLAMIALSSAPLAGAHENDSTHGPLIDAGIRQDCTQIPPEWLPPGNVDNSPSLPVEVRVMVDARDLTLAGAHMRTAKEAYRRIGIALKVSYEPLKKPPSLNGSPQADFLNYMKGYYGGQRPAGVDVVYFMTRDWAGGFADCIGGVRYPDRAFAFGSIEYAVEGIIPAPTVDEGVIAAHEIGHLLGAHHHYSNCIEATAGGPVGELGPCTTMSPAALTASPDFGTLEKMFIRDYAARYSRG